MPATETEVTSRTLFTKLRSGDKVHVDHTIKVGLASWNKSTTGTVVRTERLRNGLHYKRASDDKVYTDHLTLRLEDGELTSVTMDEYTVLKRV